MEVYNKKQYRALFISLKSKKQGQNKDKEL
ncbi:hypothetical protein AA637_05635 [Cyanobacterium sp. HL-69]|nr:hypothetical protein AA637_05635 [Cyanobacterium sp. HL-69]